MFNQLGVLSHTRASLLGTTTIWRANEKLELVHSIVYGPTKTISLNDNKYFILFIDDFTRMTRKFKALVEAQSSYILKKLRINNGKELHIRAVKGMTLVRAWRGLKSSIKHLSFEDASTVREWNQAMNGMMTTTENNKTWQLVYRIKLNPNGFVNKYKAKLVVKGYIQQCGIDYIETIAPIARMDEVWHLDVKSAFLNHNLAEEIYVAQPKGFFVKENEDKVFKLHKALYGMKQASIVWQAASTIYKPNFFPRLEFPRSAKIVGPFNNAT
ncbi:Copia protein, partial [Mucuna pruriens]